MQLVRYETARQAIADYKTVDEVKDFRDKALAIEAYAKQANDHELERDAAIARVRAERRCGELLAEMEKAKGSARPGVGRAGNNAVAGCCKITQPRTLADLGLTKDQSSKWQKLAAVPEEEFEAAINLPGAIPRTDRIITPRVEPAERLDATALWLWGRLLDMERDGVFNRSVDSLLTEMTDAMREDADRVLYKLRRWIR
jgi:hypothetical protein